MLPVAGKIFERILYNIMYENNLIFANQSGFKPGDSCMNKLLSITHEIYKPFDDGLETLGIFLDISKVFDKVWHKALLHKIKQNGISGKMVDIITDFLNFRKQRVVLNDQHSSWTIIEAGIPQGSIFGPLLFLIYINDLITSIKIFADNTSLFSIVHSMNMSITNLNNDLNKIRNWSIQWKINFDPGPSKQAQEVIFSRKL